MFKKLTMWGFFTVISGLIPIFLVCIICKITNTTITFIILSSALYFFNLMILADGMRELYDLNKYVKVKVFLFACVFFLIIILSILYGILLLNDFKDSLGLNLEIIYSSSPILTLICFVVSLCIQIIGGVEYEIYNK